jgi:hypothetical protein
MFMLKRSSGPGTGGWMTITFKLERLDGTSADPPSYRTGSTSGSIRSAGSHWFVSVRTTSQTKTAAVTTRMVPADANGPRPSRTSR